MKNYMVLGAIMESVTFFTSFWEMDWKILLKTMFLENKIARNAHEFTNKVLMINNVKAQ
jgi:hypothetical protein